MPTPSNNQGRWRDPNNEELQSIEIPLEGGSHLHPPKFTPLPGSGERSDGESLTRIGSEIEKLIAGFESDPNLSDIDIDLGYLRTLEALIVDSKDNVDAIRAATIIRTPSGAMLNIRGLRCWTQAAHPAPDNTRDFAYLMRTLGLMFAWAIAKMVVKVKSGLAGLVQVHTQQTTGTNRAEYKTEADRTWVDSIVLEGIVEPVRLAMLRFTDGDNSGWVPATYDGWNRIQTAQALLAQLLSISTRPGIRHMELAGRLVSHDVVSVREFFKWMLFHDSDLASGPDGIWPHPQTSQGISNWLSGASVEQRAAIRLATFPAELCLWVTPKAGHTVRQVIFARQARAHVKEFRQRDWDREQQETDQALSVIDILHDGTPPYISASERALWRGEDTAPLADNPDAVPFRNHVVANAALMARFTVNRMSSYEAVLDGMSTVFASRRKETASRLAATLVATHTGSYDWGRSDQLIATLAKTFDTRSNYEVSNTDDWTAHLSKDVTLLAADALAEHTAGLVNGLWPDGKRIGPAMRALALLALVAHTTSRALYDFTDVDGRTNHTMTRTGRGGRGGVSKAEAGSIMVTASKSVEGIEALGAIYRAAVDPSVPDLPVDPTSGEILTEVNLRTRFAPEPPADPADPLPTPVSPIPMFDVDNDEHMDDDDYRETVGRFADFATAFEGDLAELLKVPAHWKVLGLERDEWDPEDPEVAPMYTVVAVSLDDLDKIQDALMASLDLVRNLVRAQRGTTS